MNHPVPRALRDTAWEAWLNNAPTLPGVENIDSFNTEFTVWLNDVPGPNAVPNDIEAAALAAWLTQFEIDILDAKIGEIELPEGQLLNAVLSLIAACAGTSIAVALGFSAGAVAAIAVAVALAFVTTLFAAASLIGGSRKARSNRVLAGIRTRIRAIKARFW